MEETWLEVSKFTEENSASPWILTVRELPVYDCRWENFPL